MKTIVAALLALASLSASADSTALPTIALAAGNGGNSPIVAAPARYLPQITQHTSVCPDGQALTFTLQCDPGSRPPVERIWISPGVGVEICRVSETRCEPIRNPSQSPRPGFEVQDSAGGHLAVVTFGLDQLLDNP